MKRVISFAVIIAIIVASAVASQAYTYINYSVYTDDHKVIANADGLYILSWSGKRLTVDRVVPDGSGAELTLNHAPTAVSVFGDTLVALCNDLENDQLIAYTYDINNDILDSFAVNGAYVRYDKGFYFDGSNLYLPDDSDNRVIERFTTGGRLANSYSFSGSISAVVNGYGGGFYVISGGRLYKNSSDSYVPVGNSTLSAPAAFCCDDILSDSHGRIFKVSGTGMRLLFTADVSGDYTVSCVMNNKLYCANGDIICGYDMRGNITEHISIRGNAEALYAYDRSVYAATDDCTVNIIPESEFINIKNDADSIDNNSDPKAITSSIYTVDNDRYIISGISSPTTFAQFKKNMRYDGYTASLYRGGRAMSGGNVGTTMTVVFSGENNYTYELAVCGDITGEGSINSRDINELIEYLLGDLSFDGAYFIAADVSGDGAVDILDLAILCRMNK